MSEQASFALHGRNPDVLTCIANLSNDEVFTPPEFANRMLDTLADAWAKSHNGSDIWSNSSVRFLDPFTKSGIFLREIAARLIRGLESEIPDLQDRVDHVLTKQVFGIAITQLTSLLARRSLYCSKFANSPHSVATKLTSESGNIWFERIEHSWVGNTCSFCGAAKRTLDRGDLETHAYAFIHTTDPKALIAELFGEEMQFDVIIGNPPYQLGDGGGGGGASSTPIYNLFVDAAISLEPRYTVMITPSRWFSGGKGLDEFRDKMLRDHRFQKLVDFPQLYDVFPGVKIRGGISYWLWDRDHNGPCEVATMIGNELVGEPVSRMLDAYDVLVRRNEAVTILDKVARYRINGSREPNLGEKVSARKPFGLTNERGQRTPKGLSDPILLYGNQNTSFIERSLITHNHEWVGKWKVLLVKAHGTSGKEDVTILGNPIVAPPNTACTETYLVIGVCKSEDEARNLAAYMRTRFVRFLVSLRKITQNITRDSYKFVPLLSFDKAWTDAELYKRYGIEEHEISFIQSLIAERSNDQIEASNSDDDE